MFSVVHEYANQNKMFSTTFWAQNFVQRDDAMLSEGSADWQLDDCRENIVAFLGHSSIYCFLCQSLQLPLYSATWYIYFKQGNIQLLIKKALSYRLSKYQPFFLVCNEVDGTLFKTSTLEIVPKTQKHKIACIPNVGKVFFKASLQFHMWPYSDFHQWMSQQKAQHQNLVPVCLKFLTHEVTLPNYPPYKSKKN